MVQTSKSVMLIGTLIGVALVVLGSRRPSPPTPSPRISVVGSFYPMSFFAARIAGDDATVKNFTPALVEPHEFEPTPKDIAILEESQVLILNGAGLEPWASAVSSTLQSKNVRVVVTGEGLATETDPHLWLDPVLAGGQAEKIRDALIAVDPQHATGYEARANAFIGELQKLDEEFKSGLSRCAKKDFITSHAAFGYLAKRYHLRQTPISGLSPDAEPSPKEMGEIVKFARLKKVKHIFFESLVSPKLAQTIAREIGAQTLILNPIEGLTDQEIAGGRDYFTVMRENLANLRIALQCT